MAVSGYISTMDEIIELKDIRPEYRAYVKKVADALKQETPNGAKTNGASKEAQTPFPTYDTDLIQGTFERAHAYD